MGEWLDIELRLNKTSDNIFGTQYNWMVYSNNITSSEFDEGVDFWVINEHQLDGMHFILTNNIHHDH